MPSKTPAIISAILTIILLIIFVVLFLFVQLIALNGVSENQGVAAMGIAIVCQGAVVLVAGITVGWLTSLMIRKFSWNKILAVVIAVILGTVFGGIISFLFTIISIPLAGIR